MSHPPLRLNILISQVFHFQHFGVFPQGKAKKEKPCTRPLPFTRSHCKNSREAAEHEQPISVLQSNPGSRSVQQSTAACSVTQKQSHGRAHQSKYPQVSQNRVDLTKRAGASEGKVAENASKCKGQRAAVTNFKPSAHLSHHLSSIPNNTCHQNNAASSAEACAHNMNQLSIKDLSATSHAQQSVQLTEQARSSTGNSENGHFATIYHHDMNALMLHTELHFTATFFHACPPHSVMLDTSSFTQVNISNHFYFGFQTKGRALRQTTQPCSVSSAMME